MNGALGFTGGAAVTGASRYAHGGPGRRELTAARISTLQNVAIVMLRNEGFTEAEIAAATGLHPRTVRRRNKAIGRIRAAGDPRDRDED